MKKTVTINGETIEVNSLDIVEEKGEALDFGFVEIPFSNKSTNYQILSPIKITIEDDNETLVYDEMIIISDKVDRISRTSDTYTHTIGFIESISQYEKVLSASISITQPISGDKLSLKDVRDIIRRKVPFERTSIHTSTRLFTTDATEDAFLDTIEAPQFFFNNLSLRDMLNQLASYSNAIARLKDDGLLVYDFYNEFLSLIGIETDVMSKQLTADYKDFGSTTETNVENAVTGDDIEKDFIWLPQEDNWLSLRAINLKVEDDGYEYRLGDSGKIEEVGQTLANIKVRVDGASNPFEYRSVDVTNLVLEKSKWSRLDLDAPTLGDRRTSVYQSNTLYYEYGQSTISNQEAYGIFGVDDSLSNFIEKIVYDHNNQVPAPSELWYPPAVSDVDEVRATLLRVKMIPYNSYKIRQQKSNLNDVGTNTQTRSNQQGRLISSKRLGSNMKGYVERTGNDEIVIKRHHTDLSELWKIGDYFYDNGNFVMVTRKLEYNQYDIVAEYSFTRNFNRLSQFIQINQEDRQYDIPVNKQRVERKEIYEEYIEMDVNPKTNDSLLTPYGVETFMNTFRSTRSLSGGRGTLGTYPNKPVNTSVIYSDDMDDPAIGSGQGLYKPIIPHGEGTALSFGFYYDDVQKAGDRLENKSLLFGNDIDYNEYVRYTDENGEINLLQFGMFNEMGTLSEPSDNNELPVITIPNNPLIGGFGRQSLEANDSMKLVKDRSETFGMNYTLHVVPHYQWVDNFVIGVKAIEGNNLLKALSNSEPLYIWTSATEQYYSSTDNRFAKGTQTNADYDLFKVGDTYGNYTYRIAIDDTFTTGNKSWGLADADGNLYLGVNQNGGVTTYQLDISDVYFNPKNARTNIRKRFDNNPITPEFPPEAPINLTFSDLLKTGFTASWNDQSVGSDNFAYKVIRTNDFVTVDSGILPISTLSYVASGLTAGEEYQFEIKTVRNTLESSVTFGTVTTEPPIPIAPTGGNITNIDSTSFTMNWTDNAIYEDGFRVYIKNNTTGEPDFAYYGSVQKNITSFGISSLTVNSNYTVIVFAYNISEGQIQESTTYAEASATTSSPPPPPSTSPLIFGVSSDNENIYFFLQNQDDNTATLRYEINDSTPDIILGTADSGDNLGGVASGLSPGITYTLYATAQASGESVSSVSSYSQQTTAVPIAPSGLSLTFIDEGGGQGVIQADWTNEADYMDGYLVELYDDPSYTNRIDEVSYSSSSVETHTFGVTVFSGNTYYARVASKYNFQVSSWDNASISI